MIEKFLSYFVFFIHYDRHDVKIALSLIGGFFAIVIFVVVPLFYGWIKIIEIIFKSF